MLTEAGAYRLLEIAQRSLELGSDDRASAERELREAADDVPPAIDWLLDHDPPAALRLAGSLSFFWQDTGRLDEGRATTARVLASGAERGDPAIARVQLVASELAFRQSDQQEATRCADACIAHASRSGDRATAAMAHLILARVGLREGDAPRIERHAERALVLARDDPWVQRGAVHMLAWAAHTSGDRPLAQRRFEASIDLRKAQGDRFGAAVEEANLGDLAAEDGDLPEAGRRLRGALEVAVELESQYLLVNVLPSLAVVAALAGADALAARMAGAADQAADDAALDPDPGAWQPVLEDVEQRLGEQYAVLHSEGRALPADAAVRLARSIADLVDPPGPVA
jgi:tetratricopeptide (TPR) repeat protein